MEAMEIFNNFTDKYLHGNIEELRTYDFSKVISKEYGNGKSYADGDCTKIAYAIYYLLWKDKQIPLFTESNFEKLTNSYSGDTINTFNTLFGKEDSARKKIQAIFSEDEQKIVEDFLRLLCINSKRLLKILRFYIKQSETFMFFQRTQYFIELV